MISEDIEDMRNILAGLPDHLFRALSDVNQADLALGSALDEYDVTDAISDLKQWFVGQTIAEEAAPEVFPQALPLDVEAAGAAFPEALPVYPEAEPVYQGIQLPAPEPTAEMPDVRGEDRRDPLNVFYQRPELPGREPITPSSFFERPEIPAALEESTTDVGPSVSGNLFPQLEQEDRTPAFDMPELGGEVERDERITAEGGSELVAVMERVAEAVEEMLELQRRTERTETSESAGWEAGPTEWNERPEPSWTDLFSEEKKD